MKIIYSCVVDRSPKFYLQALMLVRSLRAVGVEPEDILINLTPSARVYRSEFEARGCTVRDTIFFADKKYSNKVAQLRNAPEDVDFVICCDTDLLFMRNIAPDLSGKEGKVVGKTVDFPNPPIDVLREIHALFDDLPEIRDVAADVNGEPTLAGNFNGGLYIIPGSHVRAFSRQWEHEALRLFHDSRVKTILGKFDWHIDQISFCFALNKLGLEYEALPIEYNFPLHFPVDKSRVKDPGILRILHYHDAVDENGLPDIKKVQGKSMKEAVSNVAEQLRTLIDLEAQQALADRLANHRVTFLIGFHRSGTSLMASGCGALGYSTGSGELMASSFDNPKGYFESKRLVKINEEIQKDLSSDWDDVFFSFGNRADELARKYRTKITEFLEREFLIEPHPNYLLKDPRIMQTYGLWRSVVRSMGLATPEIVFIYRNPMECAQSQLSRYSKSYKKEGSPFHFFGKDLKETLLLWYVYSVRFFLTVQNERMIVVRYSDLISKPVPTLHRVADWTGMGGDSDGISAFASEFLETGLRHNERTPEELRKATLGIPFVFKLFSQLEAMAKKPQTYPGDIRAIVEAHKEPFADLMQYDFLGRLFTVPKQKWIHERHMRASGK